MVYGVLFGDKHSHRDWQLLLNSRPEISSPVPKTNYIDIPGGDGILDLTESLTGDVQYKTRTMGFTFTTLKARRKWSSLYSDIQGYLHGQRMKIILDEDPAFYYIGRVSVDEWKSSEKYSTIAVSAEVEPYKYERSSSLEDWEWDSFNFEEGIIREYKGRMINIHPSLIPSFCGTGYYGLKVHEEALKRGVKVTGATVHFVDEGTDTGPILLQKAVEVHDGDTPEVLQRRVMEEAEWVLLPKAIDMIARKEQ